MSKKKRQVAQANKENSMGWMMTYADLMSLLMAFFVMLLATAEVDKHKFEEFGRSMRVALGSPVEVSGHSADDIKMFKELVESSTQSHEKVIKAMTKIKQTQEDAKQLENIFKEQIEQGMVEVKTFGRVIIIRMLASGVFESGEAEIKQSFKPMLHKLREKLTTIEGDIVVSGHADDIPIETERYRSNWELSSSRAYSVIDDILDKTDLETKRFVLRGFGSTRPLVPNTSAENRAKNRRVEILIDQRDPVGENVDLEKGQGIEDLPMADAPLPKNLEALSSLKAHQPHTTGHLGVLAASKPKDLSQHAPQTAPDKPSPPPPHVSGHLPEQLPQTLPHTTASLVDS